MKRGAIKRMLNRRLSMAFEGWPAIAAPMNAEQMAMQRALMRMVLAKLQRRMGGAIKRMLNIKLTIAFEPWSANAAEMKAEQMAMQPALMRMV